MKLGDVNQSIRAASHYSQIIYIYIHLLARIICNLRITGKNLTQLRHYHGRLRKGTHCDKIPAPGVESGILCFVFRMVISLFQMSLMHPVEMLMCWLVPLRMRRLKSDYSESLVCINIIRLSVDQMRCSAVMSFKIMIIYLYYISLNRITLKQDNALISYHDVTRAWQI